MSERQFKTDHGKLSSPPASRLKSLASSPSPFRRASFSATRQAAPMRRGTNWGIVRTEYSLTNHYCYISTDCMVRVEGLEPPRLAASEPKSGASTNFATPASWGVLAKLQQGCEWKCSLGRKHFGVRDISPIVEKKTTKNDEAEKKGQPNVSNDRGTEHRGNPCETSIHV